MAVPLMQLEKVSFGWDRPEAGIDLVIGDASLSIDPHQSLAIMGESGVGKTTLCRLMAGLVAPLSGRVLFDGVPMIVPRSAITISFQDYPFFPWLSVEDNVLFGRPEKPTSLGPMQKREYSQWLLERLGLADSARKYRVVLKRASTLSSGTRV